MTAFQNSSSFLPLTSPLQCANTTALGASIGLPHDASRKLGTEKTNHNHPESATGGFAETDSALWDGPSLKCKAQKIKNERDILRQITCHGSGEGIWGSGSLWFRIPLGKKPFYQRFGDCQSDCGTAKTTPGRRESSPDLQLR